MTVAIPEASQVAIEYLRLSNIFWALDKAIWLLLPIVFMVLGLSAKINHRVTRKVGAGVIAYPVFVFIYFALDCLVRAPIQYLWSRAYSERFGKTPQNLLDWALGQLGSWITFIIFASAMALIFTWLVKRSKKNWWIYVALGLSIISTTYLFLEPDTHHYRALNDNSIEQQVAEIAKQSDISADRIGIEYCDPVSSCPPGRVIGAGPTRLLLLNEGYVHHEPLPYVKQTVAHESKHFYKDDNSTGIFLIALLSLTFFFFLKKGTDYTSHKFGRHLGINDCEFPQVFPVFMLIGAILYFTFLPLVNAIHRKIETDADIYAMKTTGDSISQAKMIADYAVKNDRVAELDDFYLIFRATHPSDASRIRLANDFRPPEGASSAP